MQPYKNVHFGIDDPLDHPSTLETPTREQTCFYSDEMDEAVNIKLLCYNAAIKRMQKS